MIYKRDILGVGAMSVALLVMLTLAWKFSQPDTPPQVQQIAVPTTDMNGLLQTSIANIQHQGKLEVMSLDIQSVNTSMIDGWISHSEVTTLSKAKVQYIMNLGDFKPEWVSYDDNVISVTLPKTFLKTEIIPTSELNTNHNGWFSNEANDQKITSHNVEVNQSRMISQANSMLDIARPVAAEDLEHLFEIPLNAVDPDVKVRI